MSIVWLISVSDHQIPILNSLPRVLYGYEGNKIVKVGSGAGGLDELKALLQDDQVQYGYLRVTSGDSESKRAKFVFISWVGEKVGPLKRAKVSVHKANIKNFVQVPPSPPSASPLSHPSRFLPITPDLPSCQSFHPLTLLFPPSPSCRALPLRSTQRSRRSWSRRTFWAE